MDTAESRGARDEGARAEGALAGPGAEAARGPRPARLIALFAAALAVFNFPLLLVWDQPALIFGLPLLGVAIFALWAGLILALALVSEG